MREEPLPVKPDGRLGPDQRSRALAAMAAAPLDVLVIGGGIVGSGAALDAATRGLRVGLVEAGDFASGTSSRSSKLIHGGLRYLEMGDFALVREALAERDLLARRLAPHLVRAVPLLYPLTRRGWERLYVGAGIALYDVMARVSTPAASWPAHRHLSRRGALRRFPALRAEAVVGAVEYHDGQVDDARYSMVVARTAAAHGALVANRCQVTAFLRDGDRIGGVVVRDLDGGDGDIALRAGQVISATGVWTDETLALAGIGSPIRVRASKGVHLVVPAGRIRADAGLIARTRTSVLFVLPWGRYWIIGTTDTDWDLDKARPVAGGGDIDYLLAEANRWLDPPLVAADVVGVYAGLRPLLDGAAAQTSRLSRRHAVTSPAPGLVVVAGGKYTTYRVMARDAVNLAVSGLGGALPGSCTDRVPLLGADGYQAVANRSRLLAGRTGLAQATVERLIGRYGSLVYDLLALLEAEPGLGAPLPGGGEVLGAEIRYAATHEGARHLDDVLVRRTWIGIESRDGGSVAAAAAAGIMAPVLGWDEAAVREEVDGYRRRVADERGGVPPGL